MLVNHATTAPERTSCQPLALKAAGCIIQVSTAATSFFVIFLL
jgi:hypothetical protein